MKVNKFTRFGSKVFSQEKIKQYLNSEDYFKWQEFVNSNQTLTKEVAIAMSNGIRNWALENGCTHFAHWFTPLNRPSAKKNVAFIEKVFGKPLVSFNEDELILQELDASSMPSGGLRETSKAKGYTYWDYNSVAFIIEKILYIPTIFMSIKGQPLDSKSLLINSGKILSSQVIKILRLLGDNKTTKVVPSVGLEQEYFLISKKEFSERLDLKLTGRTLIGAASPKNQKVDSHYLSQIPIRVKKFMEDVDEQLWSLGIYAKAEHNEAAPAQYELACIYDQVNLIVDQNQIVMEILMSTALRHDMVCLLDEKPFKGISGSGKHNNWSLMNQEGENIFKQKSTKNQKILFLLLLSAFIRAVNEYPELLRLSSSNPSNDDRLTEKEAPPGIISIYTGMEVKDFISLIDSDLENLNESLLTPADRNRTSPIVFTNDKFEFRMLGSSLNASFFNTVINLALAKVLEEYDEILSKNKNNLIPSIYELIKQTLLNNQRIIFNGDSYSKDWQDEALNRNLAIIPNYIKAIDHLSDQKNIELFTKYNILSKEEIIARQEVLFEHFVEIKLMEINVLLIMSNQQIIPSLLKQVKMLKETNINQFTAELLTQTEKTISSIMEYKQEITNLLEKIHQITSNKKRSFYIEEKILPIIKKLRSIYDNFEQFIFKEFLPFNSYHQILTSLDL